jgi:hypothetical protein
MSAPELTNPNLEDATDDDEILEIVRRSLPAPERREFIRIPQARVLGATLRPVHEKRRTANRIYFRPLTHLERTGSDPRKRLTGWPGHPDVAAGPRQEEGMEAQSHTAASAATLRLRIEFLEQQLAADKLHLRLYRLGAGAAVCSVFSLAVWVFTGVGAPFHPVFAALSLPVAMGVVGMAFLVRRQQTALGRD